MIYPTSLAALQQVIREGILRPGDRISLPAAMLAGLTASDRERLAADACAADARVQALADDSGRIVISGESEPASVRPSGEVVIPLEDLAWSLREHDVDE
jgi:hypothetical protein